MRDASFLDLQELTAIKEAHWRVHGLKIGLRGRCHETGLISVRQGITDNGIAQRTAVASGSRSARRDRTRGGPPTCAPKLIPGGVPMLRTRDYGYCSHSVRVEVETNNTFGVQRP